MLEYSKTMTLLNEMKPHYDDGFTSSERGVIENLYNKVCGKPIHRSGCSDCYRDAYIEIVTTLKKLGKMPTTPNYVLKAGALLHEFGSSDFYTLNNCPDEIAEKWLATHPADIVLFERTPSDWEAKVKQKKIELGLITPDEPVDLSEAQKIIDEATKVNDGPSGSETGAGKEIPSDDPEVEKQNSRRGRPSSK